MILTNPAALFAAIRADLFGGHITQPQVDGVNVLLGAMGGWPLDETAATMQPIRERGSDAYLAKYDTGPLAEALGNTPEADGDGIKFCGRGYVMLTGLANYQRAADKLGLPLIENPDFLLNPATAAAVMRRGMVEGWFTGRKLADFLPADGPCVVGRYTQARRIINGLDRASDVAGYALQFEGALEAAA
jgi:putative chitinase